MAARQPPRRLGVRVAWFAALWAGSVLGLGLIGLLIKFALR